MDWIDAALMTLESQDQKQWHEVFSRREFQLHFCLALLFSGKEPIAAHQPSHILLTEPKLMPSVPAEDEIPCGMFLMWFDMEEYSFLRPLLSLLVQRGRIKIDRPIQEFTAALLRHCPGPSATLLRRKSMEKLLESALYAITSFVLEEGPHDSGHIVQKALNYMQANVMRNVSLQEISRISGVSQEHLIRIFKKEQNTTPMKYFAELRLHKSLELLLRGWSIHAIACEMDFYNESYYCKVFKNTFGISPGTYKKNYIRSLKKNVSVSEQLLLTSHLLTEFIDTMTDFFFVKDSSFVTIVCNQAYSKFVGMPVKEICGKTDFTLFPEKAAAFFRMSDKLVVDSGKEKTFRKWIEYPDGRKYYMETRKTPYFGPSGNILGLVCIGRRLSLNERNRVVAEENSEESRSETSENLTLRHASPLQDGRTVRKGDGRKPR